MGLSEGSEEGGSGVGSVGVSGVGVGVVSMGSSVEPGVGSAEAPGVGSALSVGPGDTLGPVVASGEMEGLKEASGDTLGEGEGDTAGPGNVVAAAVAPAGQVVVVVPAVGGIVAVGARQLAAAAAEGVLAHVVAEDPLLAGPIVVVGKVLDDSPPGDFTGVGIVQLGGIFIAVPDACHTEVGAAHKGQVIGVIRGTSLGKHIKADAVHGIKCSTHAYARSGSW